MSMMPQDKLFKEIYPSADIFIYPSFTDTFGFPLTEAMSFGLPVVCVKGQSREEIIHDGKMGFVVNSNLGDVVKVEDFENLCHEDILKDVILKAEKLIKNKHMREKMSINCLNEIENGKFSVKKSNEKLERIYREALK